MHGRNIAALLAMAGIGAARLEAAPGYLAVVGPASLRFLEPVRQVRPPDPETAPVPAPTPVVVTVTNYVTVAAASPEPAPVQPVAPPEPAPEETIRGTIGDFVRGHAPDSQYSPPSVLVRFFTQSPDSTVGTVVVPVGFVPPANTAPVPRSSATYQKGP